MEIWCSKAAVKMLETVFLYNFLYIFSPRSDKTVL